MHDCSWKHLHQPLQLIEQLDRQFSKDTAELNDSINQWDLIHVYRTHHPTAAEYTSFSSPTGTFAVIDQILGLKQALTNIKNCNYIVCSLTTMVSTENNECCVEWKKKNNNLRRSDPFDFMYITFFK